MLTGHDREIGRFAWVMAWVGLVVGQLHALARFRTADGQEDLEYPLTAAWAEPPTTCSHRCWTGAIPTSSHRPRLRHLRQDLAAGLRRVHALRVRGLSPPGAARLREVGLAARRSARTRSPRWRSSWTTGRSGPATTTATAIEATLFTLGWFVTVPGLLGMLVFSTTARHHAAGQAVPAVLAGGAAHADHPAGVRDHDGHLDGQRRAAGDVRVRHPRSPDRPRGVGQRRCSVVAGGRDRLTRPDSPARSAGSAAAHVTGDVFRTMRLS